MTNPERYPFITIDPVLGEAGFRPRLPLTLTDQKRSLQISGIIDTGGMMNVLPYLVAVQ